MDKKILQVSTKAMRNKTKILRDIKKAVEEMKLIKAGKLKGRNAEELFAELQGIIK